MPPCPSEDLAQTALLLRSVSPAATRLVRPGQPYPMFRDCPVKQGSQDYPAED